MSYCINPNCSVRQNPDSVEFCLACGNRLLINDRYWLVRFLRDLDESQSFEVFEADDQGTSKVLKFLKSKGSHYKELFEQEARILINLRHSGIPKAELSEYFTFRLENGRTLPCLVMEKIEGQNLLLWLQENGSISQDLALQWLKELAEILGYVHQKGFFHRDIKPSNIMRKPDGQIVLIDFGTAREVTQTVIDGREVTAVLSHGYTAPEQIEHRAVPQSDFFALGRTFVHLLTGKHPNDFSKDPQTRQLIWQDSAPDISTDLKIFIDELMAPSVQDRPKNIEAIQQRIEQVIEAIQPRKQFDDETRDLPPAPNPPPPTPPTPTPDPPQPPPHRWRVIFGYRYPIILLGVVIVAIFVPPPPPRPTLCDSTATDVSAIDFSSNGKYLATVSLDKTVRVLQVATTVEQVACKQHADGVVAVKFSPKGTKVATASLDSTAGLGEISSDGSISIFKFLPHKKDFPVVALDFSSDGEFLATGSADGTVKVWNTNSRGEVALIKSVKSNYVRAVSFSRDGKYLAIASLKNQAQVWEWKADASGKKPISLPPNDVVAVAFNPTNDKHLATVSANGIAQVWDTTSKPKEVARLEPNTYITTGVSFSPDGRHIATTSLENKAQVWEWQAHKFDQKTITLPPNDVVAVAFSPTNRNYLATASTNGTAKVWQTTGNNVGTLPGKNSLVAVAFSPTNGNYLATASADGTVQIRKW